MKLSFVFKCEHAGRGAGGGRSPLPEWGAGGTPAGGPGGGAPWWGDEGGEAPPAISAYRGLKAKIFSLDLSGCYS